MSGEPLEGQRATASINTPCAQDPWRLKCSWVLRLLGWWGARVSYSDVLGRVPERGAPQWALGWLGASQWHTFQR